MMTPRFETQIEKAQQSELIRIAHLLADAAEHETLRFFRRSYLDVLNKAEDQRDENAFSLDSLHYDPVTQADRAAEHAMREILRVERPDDGILGEEFDNVDSSSGLTWVLDPIDGTRSFVFGTPTWGVLIGLYEGNRPVFGMIVQPYLKERFIGGFGLSCLERAGKETPLQPRQTRKLKDAFLMTTFPEIGPPPEKAAFDRVANNVRATRYGADCYAYALLALGQIDLVIEAGLQPYDIAAPIAVIEAAGGIVTDWSGQSFENGIPSNTRVLAAANHELHQQALERLAFK